MPSVARRMTAIGLVAGLAAVARSQDVPQIARFVPPGPDPAHVFVLDSAHLLSPQEVRALQDSARALQTETAADVAWVTLPTLGGRPIEEAALYIGRTWRIGSAGQPGDPLRNRGLVILYIPDKTKTAGPNFRIEVGNGLEGTITDSRSRAISAAMREDLRAKRYDAAYAAGWRVAAGLVREDFASHDEAGRAAAAAAREAAMATLASRRTAVALEPRSGVAMVVPILFLGVLVVLFVLLALSRRRGLASPTMIFPVRDPDDDDPQRRNQWFSSSGGSDSSSSDSGSSSSDGGSFGDGGGFSGGGSSDTI